MFKNVFRLAIAATVSCVFTAPVIAEESFPSKTVNITVGYKPGGSTSILGRKFADSLSKKTGATFIVLNRPGANSNVAMREVLKAKPDGYNIMLVSISNAINQTVYKGLEFNLGTDYQPLALLGTIPNILAVNPKMPIKTLSEYIQYAKEHPGKVTCSNPGNGSSAHLSCLLLNERTGINARPIPYPGSGPSMTALVAGEVDSALDNLSPMLGFFDSGDLRPISIASPKRSSILPDVPTMAESGLDDFNVAAWFGLVLPKNTPQDVVNKLNTLINDELRTDDMKEFLESKGYMVPDPDNNSPEQFGAYMNSEIERWGKVANAANLSVK